VRSLRTKGLLSIVMVVLLTLVGLVNFFAPFFTDYKTDPLITYIFMGTASGIAGFKGVASLLVQRILKNETGQKEEE
jgi:hypothetical protein